MSLKNRSFLKLLDYTPAEIEELLDLAADLKARKKAGIRHNEQLAGKNIALIFEKKRVCTQFPYGWECIQGEGNLEIRASFKNLGILYYATVNGKSGQYDIYIDGEAAGTINADFSGGWGDAIKADQVYTSDVEKEHIITIKKSPESTGDLFELLGLLVS